MASAFGSVLAGSIDLTPTLGAACIGIVANFVLAGVASGHHVAYWSADTPRCAPLMAQVPLRRTAR